MRLPACSLFGKAQRGKARRMEKENHAALAAAWAHTVYIHTTYNSVLLICAVRTRFCLLVSAAALWCNVNLIRIATKHCCSRVEITLISLSHLPSISSRRSSFLVSLRLRFFLFCIAVFLFNAPRTSSIDITRQSHSRPKIPCLFSHC